MDKIIRNKIIEKLNGMVYVRKLENQSTRITIPEFKFIICSVKVKGDSSFRIHKREWFHIAKELEKDGVIKLHFQNPIEVLTN